MVDLLLLQKTIDKIERQLRKHGFWKRPNRIPPHVKINHRWDEISQEAAVLINRVLVIRSLPVCSKMFGPARESTVLAFHHDHKTGAQRMNFVRSELNRLISELRTLPIFGNTTITRIAA